ncbi:MAG: hypothetical protein ACRDX9_11015 [Acidimicrobiia bacterium]
MTWKNDAHGLVFKSSELKLYRPTHTWGMKLSQLHRQQATVRIVTFRLPGSATYDDYYETQIARRPSDMLVLIGTGGRPEELMKARELKDRFPEVRIAVHSELHVKAVAIGPKTLYVGLANFGSSSWADLTLGVRSIGAHDYFVGNIFDPLWREATEVAKPL